MNEKAMKAAMDAYYACSSPADEPAVRAACEAYADVELAELSDLNASLLLREAALVASYTKANWRTVELQAEYDAMAQVAAKGQPAAVEWTREQWHLWLGTDLSRESMVAILAGDRPESLRPPTLTRESVQAALNRAAAGSNELKQQCEQTFRLSPQSAGLLLGAAQRPAQPAASGPFGGHATISEALQSIGCVSITYTDIATRPDGTWTITGMAVQPAAAEWTRATAEAVLDGAGHAEALDEAIEGAYQAGAKLFGALCPSVPSETPLEWKARAQAAAAEKAQSEVATLKSTLADTWKRVEGLQQERTRANNATEKAQSERDQNAQAARALSESVKTARAELAEAAEDRDEFDRERNRVMLELIDTKNALNVARIDLGVAIKRVEAAELSRNEYAAKWLEARGEKERLEAELAAARAVFGGDDSEGEVFLPVTIEWMIQAKLDNAARADTAETQLKALREAVRWDGEDSAMLVPAVLRSHGLPDYAAHFDRVQAALSDPAQAQLVGAINAQTPDPEKTGDA